jgi:hypothetical protein
MSEAREDVNDNVVPIEDDEDDEVVDLDLDELDDQLRKEALGQATTVKIDGRVFHITHAGDWSTSAMQAATQGDWDTWAREVLEDSKEYQEWGDLDLRNYQIEAVFNECGRQARMNMGKSRRRSGSRRGTRRR